MVEQSAEGAAYATHRVSYNWLELVKKDEETRLGCKICREFHPGKSGFSAGDYKVGKYFYARTLSQHQVSTHHKESVARAKKAEAPGTPPARPPAGSPRRGLSPRTPGSPSCPRSSARSSTASSPGEDPDRPTDTARRFENLLAGAYATIYHKKSSADFRLLTDYATLCGGSLPVGHTSEQIFTECRDIICKELLAHFVSQVRQSPYFAVAIDEKDRFLIIVISYFLKGQRVTIPAAYRDLQGFEARDLFSLLTSVLESWGLDKQYLVGFTADGASVMGTRVALGNRGQNVAKLLCEWAGHPLLITHCAPHRLQLCVVASWTDPYLKDLEKRIKALIKNVSEHPGATIDLVFWSDLVDEDVLPSLSSSTARWLSFYQPVKKLLKCYLGVLCHLMYCFNFHSSHEQKKTITWLFQGLATWEARLTLAGIADILEICMSYKNQLERASSFTGVHGIQEALRAELDAFCRINSVSATAMAGDDVLPGGGKEVERMCERYRREGHQKLHLLYTAAGNLVDEWVTLKDIESNQAMKNIFKRLQEFATICSDKVMERFAARSDVWKNAHIFHQKYEYNQNSFQNALWEIGSDLNIEQEELIKEMRSAFAIRDVVSAREKVDSAESLWASVLQGVQERADLPEAERLISSFLLSPSQAATCEWGFSTVVRLKERLHDCSPLVLEQYLQVGHFGKPLQEMMSSGTTKTISKQFMKLKNCRAEHVSQGNFYMRGRFMVPRKRKQRPDSGKRRGEYKFKKKRAGLRAQASARALQRGEGEEVAMAEPVEEVPEHNIWRQMSPRKQKKDQFQSIADQSK